MLAERDLIGLDTRLCAYLPNCPAHWQEITIQNLLNHTSGFPEDTTLFGADEMSRDLQNVPALVDLFKDEPLSFSAGDSYL